MQWSESAILDLRSCLEISLDQSKSLPMSREDLIDETIMRVFAASRKKNICARYAYAAKILKNLIRDQIRRLQRRRRVMEVVANCRGACIWEDDVQERLEDRELIDHLLVHTDLTPRQRDVVEMMYFNDTTPSNLSSHSVLFERYSATFTIISPQASGTGESIETPRPPMTPSTRRESVFRDFKLHNF